MARIAQNKNVYIPRHRSPLSAVSGADKSCVGPAPKLEPQRLTGLSSVSYSRSDANSAYLAKKLLYDFDGGSLAKQGYKSADIMRALEALSVGACSYVRNKLTQIEFGYAGTSLLPGHKFRCCTLFDTQSMKPYYDWLYYDQGKYQRLYSFGIPKSVNVCGTDVTVKTFYSRGEEKIFAAVWKTAESWPLWLSYAPHAS